MTGNRTCFHSNKRTKSDIRLAFQSIDPRCSDRVAEPSLGFGERKRIRLSFCIDRDSSTHLLESPPSTDQQVVELDDAQLKFAATMVSSPLLEWWLRDFGGAISHVRRHPVAEVTK